MRVQEIAGDWGVENLKLAERPTPTPGPGEVLLKMKAASLNYRDLVVASGGYGRRAGSLPLIPVSDGVGVVEALGEGVEGLSVGERVCPLLFQDWLAGELDDNASFSSLGGPLDGVLSEYMVVKASGLVKTPEHLSDAEAATLPCAGLTAWAAVIGQGVKPGDTVLILGTGGVALFALQFAKMAGAEVIITSKSDEKLARARELGADHTINYLQNPEWGKTAKEISGGPGNNNSGVDIIVETGGGGTLPQSLQAIRTGGTISLMGVLGGQTMDARVYSLVMRRVRLQGITLAPKVDFEAMNRAIALHRLRPIVDRVFPFEESGEAFTYLKSQGHFGKVCISVGE